MTSEIEPNLKLETRNLEKYLKSLKLENEVQYKPVFLKDDESPIGKLSFDENWKLKDCSGKNFVFDVHFGDQTKNQQRYNQLTLEIRDYIYYLLEKHPDSLLHKLHFPLDQNEINDIINNKKTEETNKSKKNFVFVSNGALTSREKLLIMIHGSGMISAGQWSMRIIINNNLMEGSKIPFIKKAKQNGFQVLLANTNQREDNLFSSSIKHMDYIWENIIKKISKAKKIYIIAHSKGGSDVIHLAKKYKEDFEERVEKIAITDSGMDNFFYPNQDNYNIKHIFEKKCVEWLSSGDPIDTPLPHKTIKAFSAGTIEHIWTTPFCLDSIFKFFEDNNNNNNNNNDKNNNKYNKNYNSIYNKDNNENNDQKINNEKINDSNKNKIENFKEL